MIFHFNWAHWEQAGLQGYIRKGSQISASAVREAEHQGLPFSTKLPFVGFESGRFLSLFVPGNGSPEQGFNLPVPWNDFVCPSHVLDVSEGCREADTWQSNWLVACESFAQ